MGFVGLIEVDEMRDVVVKMASLCTHVGLLVKLVLATPRIEIVPFRPSRSAVPPSWLSYPSVETFLPSTIPSAYFARSGRCSRCGCSGVGILRHMIVEGWRFFVSATQRTADGRPFIVLRCHRLLSTGSRGPIQMNGQRREWQ